MSLISLPHSLHLINAIFYSPNFTPQPNFDLEPFFGVESKNSLEINTYAVRSDYRSAGLAKAMLYETLKAMFAIYFENPSCRYRKE